MSNFSSWENTTSYLIDPNETTKEIQNSPSFVPIYVKSRSDLKKTISKYKLDNLNEKDNYYDYSNNIMEQNIFLENLGNLSIFDNSYIDCSYNLLYNGASKLYNIINNMI